MRVGRRDHAAQVDGRFSGIDLRLMAGRRLGRSGTSRVVVRSLGRESRTGDLMQSDTPRPGDDPLPPIGDPPPDPAPPEGDPPSEPPAPQPPGPINGRQWGP